LTQFEIGDFQMLIFRDHLMATRLMAESFDLPASRLQLWLDGADFAITSRRWREHREVCRPYRFFL
jgi:hypothetical protein